MRNDNRLTDFLSRVAIFVIVLIGIVGVFGWYLPLIKENQSLRKEIADQEMTVTVLTADISRKKKLQASYDFDPASVVRLARENLGHHKEGETVYKFEE